MTRRYLALALCAVAALSACDRRQEAAAPPAAKAPLAGPLTYEKTSDAAEVKLALPEAVGRFPALYAKLYAEGKNTLDAFAEGAVEDAESLKEAGLPSGYAREIEYALTVETPRLLGLTRSDYENTGGAHPNGSMTALTWDKASGKAVATAELFAPGADMAPLDRALCEAIKAEKKARTGAETLDGELTACPRLVDVSAALEPSTVPGKAGGITALFSPYVLGPYVEGGYEIVLPLPVIRSALAPAYAGEFAGQPPPRPKE